MNQISLAVWNALDGPQATTWGAGLYVLSVVQKDEEQIPEPPADGGDRWKYRSISAYEIKHQTAIPTLS